MTSKIVGALSPPPRGQARVGCSGWVYDDWKDVVYPAELRRSDWFAYYAFAVRHRRTQQHLLPASDRRRDRTVGGAGSSGLRLRGEDGWVRLAPHEAARRDAMVAQPPRSGATARAGPRAQPGAAAPSMEAQCRTARRVSRRRPEGPPVGRRTSGSVVAPRRCVRGPGTSRCCAVSPRSAARPALVAHDVVDLHPVPRTSRDDEPYRGRYGGRRLWRAARALNEWLEAGVDAYAYFNNDFDGHAVADAEWLRSRVDAAHAASRCLEPRIR